MIRRISSSLSTFKALTFSERLNIVLADKTIEDSPGRSRNGAGKSSIVEIIHFALGATAGPASLFRTPTLVHVEFSVILDIDGQQRTIRRKGHESSVVFVAPTSGPLSIGLETSKKVPAPHYRYQTWQHVLGKAYFGLPMEPDAGEATDSVPSFRTLIGYFVRRVHDGAIDSPHRIHRSQQPVNIQVNLSFLFDLDYRLAGRLESIRKRDRQLKELKAAAKTGALGFLLRTSAQIRPDLASSQDRVLRMDANLRSFKIHDFYRESVQDAASLKKKIRELQDEALLDEDALQRVTNALDNERDTDQASVQSLYAELTDVLPGAVQKRLNQVVEFHQSVAANRQRGLQGQRRALAARLASRYKTIEELDDKRAKLLTSLEGAGALDDFIALQAQLAIEQQNLRALREAYDQALMIEGGATTLELERNELEQRIRADHAERGKTLEHAALIVRELVASLYADRLGNLFVDVTKNGPHFKIEMDSDRSEGISRMEIWCFDMLLARLCAERGFGPGFVVHDSHVFDGVDSRQISAALEKGLQYSEQYGFQYIVLLNSDVYERLEVNADVRKSVNEVRLSDNRDDGGLFGCIIAEKDSGVSPEPNNESGQLTFPI